MSGASKIEWTDYSWNPIRARNRQTGKPGWFCVHTSPGCERCYAESMNLRLGNGVAFKAQHRDQVESYLDDKALLEPLRWRKPRVVFVCSMTDLFGEFVQGDWINRIFAVMALCPQHTFIVLTKRSAAMQAFASAGASAINVQRDADDLLARRRPQVPVTIDWPLRNVWLGVSIEDRRRGLERTFHLASTPAAVRFWSVEPLLEALGDLTQLCLFDTVEGGAKAVDWVIVGGESGAKARPMHANWARDIRDQCAAAGVQFFFKQWGEWAPASDGVMRRVGKKAAGRLLDGVEHNARPSVERGAAQ